MHTRWKVSKPVRFTLFLMETVLVVALAALIVMSTSWFQHVLERQVITSLENITGGRVEVEHFRFRPWLLQISVENLVIHGSENAGDLPMISARDVEAAVSPEQLLSRRVHLRHLDLDGLRIHLRTNSRGITNLPTPPEQRTPQQGLADLINLSIGRLTLSHSTFFWNDQRQPVEIEGSGLAILLHMTHGRYQGTISSSSTRIRSQNWSTPSIVFSSRFELSPASLVFSSFVWQAPGSAGEASFTILPRPTLEASGFFHASTQIPALARMFHTPDLRDGNLQIEGQAAYQGGTISAQGRAHARDMVIFTPAFPSLRLNVTTSYTLESRQLTLTNLVAEVWGGTVQGSFQADFENLPAKFHLNAQLHRLRVRSALDAASTPPLLVTQLRAASVVDGTLGATWFGQEQGLKADFDLALHALTATSPHELPVSGTARGSLERARGLTLHLTASEFRTPHSTITAHGILRQFSTAPASAEPLALTVTTTDFEEWRPFFQSLVAAPTGIPLELNSLAEFSGQLGGSSEEPSVRGHVKIGLFRYHGWEWDRLAAGVELNPGYLQISGGRVEHGRTSFELNGNAQLEDWRLMPRSEVRLSAQAERTPIEDLQALISSDLPVRGFVSGHMDVEGAAASLAGSGMVRVENGAVADEPIDSLTARLSVKQSIWKVQDIKLTKARGRVTGNFTFEPERHFVSGQLQGSNLRLADFHRLAMTAADTLPVGRVDGDLNFEAHGQGTEQDFHLQSLWRLQNLSAAGTSIGEASGTLTGLGNQLRLEGEVHSPEGTLHLNAAATAIGDWLMEAHGEFAHLRADPWIRAFFKREFGATVTLDGSFHAVGPLRTPEKIEIQSHAQDVAVDFPSIQWRNAEPVDVRYSDGRVTLSRFVMRGPSTELAVEGQVHCMGGVTLAISAEGAANASLLTVFDPALQAAGRSTLRLRLTGTPDRPAMNGAIDIQDMSLGYKDLPFRFSGLHGTIKLEGERAVIDSLQGSSGGGTVGLSGFVTLVESPRFEVRADLNQVRMRYPPSFTSVFGGHLRLLGDVEQAQLSGDIIVSQMVINERVDFISKIMESSSPMPDQPVSVNSSIASMIRLNVRVSSAPPVQVQTSNLRLMGDIDLRLQGTLADPAQVGSIHFLSGESVFRGNRYTLVRGDINMTNPFRTQAYLDMEAQTRVQNYDVTLDISGPFDRLKFSYRSDPPLANTDILSLLALGYVKQEQAYSTTAGNPSASIGASAILSEALSSQTTSRIQHLFGVSRIKIDPNVGIPGYGSGALVTVEQQVTHDLTLTYVTDTSYSQYRIIQFEWNITDKVSVLGIRDQNGVFGVEFRFRQRFK